MKHPSPELIKATRIRYGLTQTAAGHLVHGGLRSWQQWEQGARRMHPGLWELFLLKVEYPETTNA